MTDDTLAIILWAGSLVSNVGTCAAWRCANRSRLFADRKQCGRTDDQALCDRVQKLVVQRYAQKLMTSAQLCGLVDMVKANAKNSLRGYARHLSIYRKPQA